MERRTKIVATVGPASDDPRILQAMVAAGMDTARLSLSHGTLDETLARIDRVRGAAAAEGRIIGVLADLPGPKIRAAEFPEGGVHLEEGSTARLVPAELVDRSDGARIAVDLPTLLDDLRRGDTVGLGDGAIQLTVDEVSVNGATATVVAGGWAQGRPGVTLPPGRATLSSPTAEDLVLLEALTGKADAVAISFVRTPADIVRARAAAGADAPMLVAKIETQEAVDAVESIIAVADGVMVARGDLGIRCALEDVPHYQKHIIRTGVAYGRPVITATQMLESMVRAPTPTRAEVSDIANAVFDGTSALMLSGETAIGHDPVNAIRTMARIARRAEDDFDYFGWGRSLGRQQSAVTDAVAGHDRITAAVSAAGWRAAMDADVAAIVACTNSGATARAISRFRPAVPILAATPSERTARQLSMAWGITPLLAGRHGTTDEIVRFAVIAAVETGMVKVGDLVAVLVGSPTDPNPATDTLRVVRVR
ncbi:MAG TPA: pyruvate kinase [Acidimicrobiales bacterium]|nr:pyruvate kinase [Acidimicrobiales bacterium]